MPYFLYDGSKSIGPFEPADLAKRPGFSLTTLVFPAGATGADAWKPASAFPDIAAALAPAAPPPPPPPPAAPAAAPAAAPFTITLTMPPPKPVEPEPAPAPKPAPAPAPAPVAQAGGAPVLADPKTKKILVVDDDDSVRSFIEMTAQMQGFQVITAVDGLDAQAKLGQGAPDLIITDLMMPGQGGYEFLRSLQAAGSGSIPVFVITGSALEDGTIRLIKQEANVVEFVAKPVRVPAFVAALHKHLRTSAR
jgi:CheY-like chemotaxis protein